MVRKAGKIVYWNEKKAYGFIEPSAGGKQVFAHITAFKRKTKPPTIGSAVSFQLAKDSQGRLNAVDVLYAGERVALRHKPKGVSKTLVFIPVYSGLFRHRNAFNIV